MKLLWKTDLIGIINLFGIDTQWHKTWLELSVQNKLYHGNYPYLEDEFKKLFILRFNELPHLFWLHNEHRNY